MIHTKRLKIRAFNQDDLQAMLLIYNDKNTMRYIPNANHSWNKYELEKKYLHHSAHYPYGYGLFVIEEKQSGQVIGEAGLFNSFDNVNNLELGYIIDRQFWRQGFGFEVCTALVNHAFTKLQCTQVRARMYDTNLASIYLAQKCKMQLEKIETADNGQCVRQYVIKKRSL